MQAAAKRADELKHGKAKHTGRELLTSRPELFVDDDAADEGKIEREAYVDPPADPLDGLEEEPATTSTAASSAATPTVADGEEDDDEGEEEDGDGEGEEDEGEEGGDESKVAIDESLFTDGDLPDDED